MARPERTLIARAGAGEHEVTRLPDGRLEVGGRVLQVSEVRPGEYLVADGDARTRVFVAAAQQGAWVFAEGHTFRVSIEPAGRRRGPAGHEHQTLTAPMPATVRQVRVSPGDAVTQGETVLVLEAMKMELPVRAPRDGRVGAIHCREGELVQPGVPLLEID